MVAIAASTKISARSCWPESQSCHKGSWGFGSDNRVERQCNHQFGDATTTRRGCLVACAGDFEPPTYAATHPARPVGDKCTPPPPLPPLRSVCLGEIPRTFVFSPLFPRVGEGLVGLVRTPTCRMVAGPAHTWLPNHVEPLPQCLVAATRPSPLRTRL